MNSLTKRFTKRTGGQEETMRDRQIDRQVIDRQIMLSFCRNIIVYIRVSKSYEFQHGNCNTFLHRAIFLKMKVEPLTTCVKQLLVGLDKFQLVKRIREDPNAFRLVFCHSNVLIWTYDLFINSMNVNCVKVRIKGCWR